MKKTIHFSAILAIMGIFMFSLGGVFAQNTANYMEQGGATWHIGSGGDLQVDSGGTVDIESGGTLEIAGTAVTSSAAELNILTGVTATATELNQSADSSGRIVNATASTLTVTEATHNHKTIVLDRAAGIAVTLPAASAGLKFRFVIKTTFTGAASIKSVAGADVMIGHAQMGNDTNDTTVLFQALAASTFDTIDLFGTANSTGGLAGQVVTIEGLAANSWYVEIIGDAAGTEATPFADTVA